jgi:putative transposase
MTLDDAKFERAAMKIEAIKPLVFLKDRTRSDIIEIAKKVGKDPRTIYRWLEKYEKIGEPNALLTPATFGGLGKSRLNRYAESILQDLLSSRYLSPQKLSIAALYTEFRAACYKNGIREVPSYWSVYRRTKNLDDKIVTRTRHGLEAFNEKYAMSGGSFEDAKFPLQTIMIDHTRLDIILLDDETGQEIGRPWLTIALDAFSRCVWGYYLGFQTPNADTAGLTIRMGALQKDPIVNAFRLHEWPVFGLPSQIHTDNGKDFRSRLLQRGCIANGITVVYRPVKRPQYGSYIERFFGTLNQKLVHGLPGTTFSNPRHKGKYNSQKNAALTIHDFEKVFLAFICDQYHNEVHSSLRTSPLEAWKEGLRSQNIVPAEPKSKQRFRQDFLSFVDPDGQRAIERDGVHFKELVYYAPELDILARYRKNKKDKFYVRFDPSDIRYMYVYDDRRDCYYILSLRSRPPAAISLHELEVQREMLRKKGTRIANEDLVMQAILRRRELIDNLVSTTKSERRRSAGHKRTSELKTRMMLVEAPEVKEDVKPVIDFRPELVDVDSVKIVRLNGGRT